MLVTYGSLLVTNWSHLVTTTVRRGEAELPRLRHGLGQEPAGRPGLRGTCRVHGESQSQDQGGVKSTPSSPRLRVRVILTDPEPVKEAL